MEYAGSAGHVWFVILYAPYGPPSSLKLSPNTAMAWNGGLDAVVAALVNTTKNGSRAIADFMAEYFRESQA